MINSNQSINHQFDDINYDAKFQPQAVNYCKLPFPNRQLANGNLQLATRPLHRVTRNSQPATRITHPATRIQLFATVLVFILMLGFDLDAFGSHPQNAAKAILHLLCGNSMTTGGPLPNVE